MGVVTMASGAPPNSSLPAPLYSFDLGPPPLPPSIDARGMLALDTDSDVPFIYVPGPALGLNDSGNDELDALSSGNGEMLPGYSFSLLFSMDRESAGAVPGNAELIELGVPYNAQDQVLRGHAAGDQFMSTLLFNLGGSRRASQSGRDINSALVRNNFDEGGTDFGGRPPTTAEDDAEDNGRADVDQDNVDATALFALDGSLSVYYSLSELSPSLIDLSGAEPPSGANVFYVFDPSARVRQTDLFATYYQLGLDVLDDVDALIVFDYDGNGTFNGTDEVLFSLSRCSPTLYGPDGAPGYDGVDDDGANGVDDCEGETGLGDDLSPADVFHFDFEGILSTFASSAELGLLGQDNVDALDLLLCEDSIGCAVNHGIRRVCGDFDNDGTLDQTDVDMFESCFTGPGGEIPADCGRGDCNGDGDIDCEDWGRFAIAWSGNPAPWLDACPFTIPTLSAWGIAVMALLTLLAGTIMFRRRRQANT